MSSKEIEARLKISAVDRASRVLRGVGEKVDQVNRKTAALNRSIDVSQRRNLARFVAEAKMAGAIEGTHVLGGNLKLLAGGALALGGANVIRSFADTERRLTSLAVTAGASATEIGAAHAAVKDLAVETALPVDQVLGGLEGLVAAGLDLKQAMAVLPSIARTAQASGSEVLDIANSADAVGRSFGIAAGEMQKAFDVMATGGKLGKFELRDMAQYLPTIAPQFAQLGYAGVDGLEDLVVAFQVVRAQAGSSEEAATRLGDVVGKIYSPEVGRSFKKFGVDLTRNLDAARRDGRDVLDVFLDLTDTALKGDYSKLSQIFGDKEARLGVLALIQAREEIKRLKTEIQASGGAVERDLNAKLGDTEARLQRAKTLAGEIGDNAVKRMQPFVNVTLEALNAALQRTADMIDDPAARLREDDKWVRDQLAHLDPRLGTADGAVNAAAADYAAALASARGQSGVLLRAAEAKAAIEGDTSLSRGERRQKLVYADREIVVAANDFAAALETVAMVADKLKDLRAAATPWPDEGVRRLAAQQAASLYPMPLAKPTDLSAPPRRTFWDGLGAMPGAAPGNAALPPDEAAAFAAVRGVAPDLAERLHTATADARQEAEGLQDVFRGLNLAGPMRDAMQAMLAEQSAALSQVEQNFRASMRRLAGAAVAPSTSGVRVDPGESMPGN